MYFLTSVKALFLGGRDKVGKESSQCLHATDTRAFHDSCNFVVCVLCVCVCFVKKILLTFSSDPLLLKGDSSAMGHEVSVKGLGLSLDLLLSVGVLLARAL